MKYDWNFFLMFFVKNSYDGQITNLNNNIVKLKLQGVFIYYYFFCFILYNSYSNNLITSDLQTHKLQ